MESRFYYVRDDRKRPVITVCLLRDGNVFSRGIAICSLDDQPEKKEGRRIALARARKAMGTGYSSEPLSPMAFHVLFSLDQWEDYLDHIFSYEYGLCKSIFIEDTAGKSMPKLTDFEKTLWRANGNDKNLEENEADA